MEGQQVRGANHARQSSVGVHIVGGHQIQPQEGKVCQVVLGELFAAQVRVNAAQAAKTPGRNAHAFEVGKLNAAHVPNHHVLNVTFTIDQGANLSAYFV